MTKIQRELTSAEKELKQLRKMTADQKKDITRMQASLESETQKTIRLQEELQQAKKTHKEEAIAKDSEKVRNV